MNTAFTLLAVPDDWPKYQSMYGQAQGFRPNQVAWGEGPNSYPCLVASFLEKGSLLQHAKKVVSCYVYVTDAQKLLDTYDSRPTVAAPVGVSAMQASFNKAMMAHAMALIDTMVRSGLCTKEQYETWFAGMLTKADQMSMEDVETIVREVTGNAMSDDEEDEEET